MEDRSITLLRACRELLNKQNESSYVLDILEQEVYYDDCNCDGYCLLEDIENLLLELGCLNDSERYCWF